MSVPGDPLAEARELAEARGRAVELAERRLYRNALLNSLGVGTLVGVVSVAIGYLAAFAFLSLTLSAGMGLGVAYGIWAASGVALRHAAELLAAGNAKRPLGK